MYFSYDEIRDRVGQLTDEDRMLLFESMFNALISTMESYYVMLGIPEREIPKKLKVEVDAVKSLIDKRIKANIELKPILLESDPTIPTDDSFAFDAKFDFQSLMNTISKSK